MFAYVSVFVHLLHLPAICSSFAYLRSGYNLCQTVAACLFESSALCACEGSNNNGAKMMHLVVQHDIIHPIPNSSARFNLTKAKSIKRKKVFKYFRIGLEFINELSLLFVTSSKLS